MQDPEYKFLHQLPVGEGSGVAVDAFCFKIIFP